MDAQTPDPVIDVQYRPEEQRFVGTMEGSDQAAFIEVEPGPLVWVFGYTEVPVAWRGKGVGAALVRAAVAEVRARGGLRIQPACPFVGAYFRRYPEEVDVLVGAGAG